VKAGNTIGWGAYSTWLNFTAFIPQAEKDALVALYNATDGAHWTNKSGWLQAGDPCTWYGVTCAEGHVTKLELRNNKLSGAIPPTLSNLTQLQILDLRGNSQWVDGGDVGVLNEMIPSDLGNLANLRDLDLCYNPLSSNIPPELGSLTQLQSLDLGWNRQYINGGFVGGLSGSIPAQLGSLTNLTGVSLDGNQLSGSIPTQLGSLTNLTYLDLGRNQLSGTIPTQLGSLTKLTYLYLGGNQLSGSIPPALGSLTNLTGLSLNANQLSGRIPTQLGSLTNLERFYFAGNNLCLPPALNSWFNAISFKDNVYSLTLTATGGGSVSILPPSACTIAERFASGAQLQVIANANSGFAFSTWSGSATGSANPLTLMMDTNKYVIAVFLALPPAPTP
jgi:Leucine-rich repeat (LRR) protein